MALKRVTHTSPSAFSDALTSRQAWRLCEEALAVMLGRTASSADLGGSSKYSSENLEDRSGEGFHGNSSWTWVSRS